jgi:uncharacterized membrane protein
MRITSTRRTAMGEADGVSGCEVRRLVLLCSSLSGLLTVSCVVSEPPVVVDRPHPASVQAEESPLAPIPDPALPREEFPLEVEPEAATDPQHDMRQHAAAPAHTDEHIHEHAGGHEATEAHPAPSAQPTSTPEHSDRVFGEPPPQEEAQPDHGHAEHAEHESDEPAAASAESTAQPAAPESETGSHREQEHEQDHDHVGHEHAHGESGLVSWLGKFHPLLVHFPIGLLVAGAAAEALTMRWRAPWLSQAARFCVLAAAISALPAAALGWCAAATREFAPDVTAIAEWHRWLGIALAVGLSLTAVLSERTARSGWSRGLGAFRVFLFSGVLLVSIQGHLGSMLTHGRDYLAW